MKNHLEESLLTICGKLENKGVKYIIVGGTAVALHGYYRYSRGSSGQVLDKPDVDIWYKTDYGNYFKLLDVIEELGQNVSSFRNEKQPDPKNSFFKLEFENFTLDFLPYIRLDIQFNTAYRDKGLVQIENCDIPYLSWKHLEKDKEAGGRDKDLEDLIKLRKVKNK